MNNLVKDIKPIAGGSIQYIDSYECIELPVKDAVKSINDMGIKTIMSSANYFDVLKKDEPELDYIGNGEHYTIGNGYAWILVDYSTLGSANKDVVNKMNAGEIPIELDSNAKECLENNCSVNGVTVSQRELVKFYRTIKVPFKSLIKKFTPKELEPRSEEEEYFTQNHKVLYHSVGLPNDAVLVALRYPLNEKTTIDDVRKYYDRLITKLDKNKPFGFRRL